MKKRLLALLLCAALCVPNSLASMAAQSTDVAAVDAEEEVKPLEEIVENTVCEECQSEEGHLETCSQYVVMEETEGTKKTEEVEKDAEEPVAEVCEECQQAEGHLETCSQYVVPTEETTEPATTPAEYTEETEKTVYEEDAEIESDDGAVSVEGVIPAGAELKVDDITQEKVKILEQIANGSNASLWSRRNSEPTSISIWSDVYDIKIQHEGDNWQPVEPITITLADVHPGEFETITVRHYLDTEAAIQEAIDNETAMYYFADGLEELFPAETTAMKAVDPEMEDVICYEELSTENGDIDINNDGSISFDTTSFSIYQVDADFSIEGHNTVSDKGTITIQTDTEVYLRWNHDDTLKPDVRGVWAITAGTDVIELKSYDDKRLSNGECNCQPDANNIHEAGCPKSEIPLYQYWYAKVVGLKPGNATITFTYRNADNTAEEQRVIYTLNIQVTDVSFRIEDQVAQNGCLVPMGADTSQIAKYEWSKMVDGVDVPIDTDALTTYAVSNGVNIAIDKGGILNTDRKEKVYTVIGYDINGKEKARDSYTVKYGNEVINGSFETPVVQGATHRQFPNGEPGLYWMTTGLGAVRSDVDMLGHDIEILSDCTGGMSKTYSGITEEVAKQEGIAPGLNAVNKGNQAAELNCEEYGALYQDVITAPGATLNWSVAHAARYPTSNTSAQHSNDHMCVIIMSAEDAKYIINKSDVDLLLNAVGYKKDSKHAETSADSVEECDCGLPSENQGKTFSIENFKNTGKDISFYIYDCAGSYDKWTANSGQYKVPPNQYLTRFFFAAAVSVTNNLAGGNFIDNVNFGEKLGYTIEYYTQDTDSNTFVQISSLTESDIKEVGTTVNANNINAEELSEYYLSYTTLNGASYEKNTTFTVQPSNKGEAPVLRLYYVQKGIDVTKKIQGINEKLTSEEKQTLLADYNVVIDLYTEQDCRKEVARATMNFADGSLSKTTMFIDVQTGKQFIPKANTNYWVRENVAPQLHWYTMVTTLPVVNQITTDADAIGSAIVVNEYSQILEADITIQKTVTNVGELVLDENQTFVFKLEGVDNDIQFDFLVINGASNLTIKNLPVGKYKLTEITEWSWRYTLESISAITAGENAETNLAQKSITFELTPDGETVIFNNNRTEDKWLSGDCYVENWWSNGTIKKRNGSDEVIE